MPSRMGLILPIKEPGSDQYVLKSVTPEDVLDQDLVAELRRLVKQGRPIRDLVSRVQERHSLALDSFLIPIVYLTQMFGIGINKASDICHEGSDLPAATLLEQNQTPVTELEQPAV